MNIITHCVTYNTVTHTFTLNANFHLFCSSPGGAKGDTRFPMTPRTAKACRMLARLKKDGWPTTGFGDMYVGSRVLIKGFKEGRMAHDRFRRHVRW